MTSAQPNDFESRMSQLEALMRSAGELLVQASTVAQRNALDIESLTQDIRRNAADIRAMSQRVDSLAAASERHDRILDYLLRKEAGDVDLD